MRARHPVVVTKAANVEIAVENWYCAYRECWIQKKERKYGVGPESVCIAFVRMWICTYKYFCTQIYMHTYVNIHIWKYQYVCVYVSIDTWLFVHMSHTYIHIYICIHICMYIDIYVFIYTCTHTYMYMHWHVCTHILVYLDGYPMIHIYTFNFSLSFFVCKMQAAEPGSNDRQCKHPNEHQEG